MDILKQKRVTDNGEGKGYFRNCVEYPYKEKPEPDEELIETRGYNVNDTHPDINTIKLSKRDEQNVNFAEKYLTKLRKSEVSLPAAMKPIEIGV